MDKELIEKFIKLENTVCPKFQYENPLLDTDVADKCANSFVKLLINSNQINNDTLHQRTLEFIHNLCTSNPNNHLCIDDDVTEVLIDTYEEFLEDPDTNTDKMLDTFLIRNFKELSISPTSQRSVKPDIVKALANLKGNKSIEKIITKDILHWKIDNEENNVYSEILKSIWSKDMLADPEIKNDDISIINKSEIEEILLSCCIEILQTQIVELEDWILDQEDLRKLLEVCAASTECFEMCSRILNSVFIKTNFRWQMQQFIHVFIDLVKQDFVTNSEMLFFCLLYPHNLRHLVVLLDIELDSLSPEMKETYISNTLIHLRKLHTENKNDVIMLLSHFKQWFDIYYDRCDDV